ncbi:MAG: biopolymer transport protein ExbD [Bacteroidia bacterium]|jgi:biopolymer transport protein ExbD
MELKRRNKVKAEFSMSSMTDIVFLLLIFFVITSRFTPEPILKVLLPKGAPEQTMDPKVIHVIVDEKLNYAVENQIIPFERLPIVLDEELSKNPEATVSIYGDKGVAYEKVMDLVYIVNELGGKPVLALEPARK